jgi:hypothetical protein
MNPQVEDLNQEVWLVTLEGLWQDAFPIPETTPNPPREWFDRGRIVISAKTGESLASSFYPSPGSPQPTAARSEEQEGLASTAMANPSPASASEVDNPFPLSPGTTWTYTKFGYTQVDTNPDQLIHGTSQTTETIAEVQAFPGGWIAHVRGHKAMLQADLGWQENGRFPLGDYEYWYVFQNDSLYSSFSPPSPTQPDTFPMLEEYHFPMAVGASWCPGKQVRASLTPEAETPVPCAYAGKRTVIGEGPYQGTAGAFDRCYQLQDQSNGGDVIQWFCEGVGRVASKYDHAGTRFGFSEELTAFSPGTLQAIPSTTLTP